MGGCRCTYRNCTVRTDGATHMFHYPVFDKIRCHQWLTNAQKLEFLNLKVSQLKNRVICQHHFKDEHFMNFKKDKLKFTAIPTLNGPFCEPGPHADNNTVSHDEVKMYSISPDDIEETEYLTLYDKKANFSVKYGDFLTNSELMDMVNLSNYTINNSKTLASIRNKRKNVIKPSVINLSDDVNKYQNKTKITNESKNEPQIFAEDHQLKIGDVISGANYVEPTMIEVEIEKICSDSRKSHDKTSKINNSNVKHLVSQQDKVDDSALKLLDLPHKQKVKILSQQKISEPVTVAGKLEPVSPSLILRIPNKTCRMPQNDDGINENDEKNVSCINILNNNAVHVEPSKKGAVTESLRNQKQLNKTTCAQISQKSSKNKINTTISSNKSLLKPKVNQDRVDAIERKRKFNMKLKDIFESCLDKIDEQDDQQTKNGKNNINNEQFGSYLSKETDLPNIHEYTIACLEARMKRMEDILLNKIDQNTQRIMELKNSILISEKKSTCTQTTSNEESKKKELYNEISKYLSTDANSLIYEELFINKYTQGVSQSVSSPKKRRRR